KKEQNDLQDDMKVRLVWTVIHFMFFPHLTSITFFCFPESQNSPRNSLHILQHRSKTEYQIQYPSSPSFYTILLYRLKFTPIFVAILPLFFSLHNPHCASILVILILFSSIKNPNRFLSLLLFGLLIIAESGLL
ncbi:unnamed protein product, partial [Vicia faba]